MEKLMKTFTKSLVQGVGLSLGLSIFVLGIFLVKGTDPLTVTNGETLTADKWNALVEKLNTNTNSINSLDGFRIKTFTGTTSVSTQTTFPHGLSADNIYSVNCSIKENTTHWVQMTRRAISGWGMVTTFDSNSIIINTVLAYAQNKPYKCIVWYKE